MGAARGDDAPCGGERRDMAPEQGEGRERGSRGFDSVADSNTAHDSAAHDGIAHDGIAHDSGARDSRAHDGSEQASTDPGSHAPAYEPGPRHDGAPPARARPRDSRPRSAAAWLYDDLLAWLCPGGLLLTALVLRHPGGLHALRAQAPELVLPTWLAGAYVLGLALSPLGRLVYTLAQAIVWPRLRQAWAPAMAFLGERLRRSEGQALPPAASMSSGQFHDADRRLREYLEAVAPESRATLDRMKVLCSLACNAAAGCFVFVLVDALSGGIADWSGGRVAIAAGAIALALIAAVYRERRRQRTQLSVWRRVRIERGEDAGPAPPAA